MGTRNDIRYSIDRFPVGGLEQNYAFEFDLEERILKGSMTDISLRGMGGMLGSVTSDLCKKLEESNELFVKMQFGEDSILAGMKLMWLSKDSSDPEIVRGGFLFSILAPEDRIRLHSIVGGIRNRNAR